MDPGGYLSRNKALFLGEGFRDYINHGHIEWPPTVFNGVKKSKQLEKHFPEWRMLNLPPTIGQWVFGG